jgi:hypothetical protein
MYMKKIERYEKDERETNTKIYASTMTVKWFIIIMLVLLIALLWFNKSLDRSLGYRMKKCY